MWISSAFTILGKNVERKDRELLSIGKKSHPRSNKTIEKRSLKCTLFLGVQRKGCA